MWFICSPKEAHVTECNYWIKGCISDPAKKQDGLTFEVNNLKKWSLEVEISNLKWRIKIFKMRKSFDAFYVASGSHKGWVGHKSCGENMRPEDWCFDHREVVSSDTSIFNSSDECKPIIPRRMKTLSTLVTLIYLVLIAILSKSRNTRIAYTSTKSQIEWALFIASQAIWAISIEYI